MIIAQCKQYLGHILLPTQSRFLFRTRDSMDEFTAFYNLDAHDILIDE